MARMLLLVLLVVAVIGVNAKSTHGSRRNHHHSRSRSDDHDSRSRSDDLDSRDSSDDHDSRSSSDDNDSRDSSDCSNKKKLPPNIVFILADDLGWDDVSFHGNNEIPTPNIDSLAYDGIQLSNYYVQPLCSPTRAALMTGRYPIRSGLQDYVIISAAPYGLGLNETIMPLYFKQLGYTTHIVGKWHLGLCDQAYHPLNRGFDTHSGIYQAFADYFTHTHTANSQDEFPPKLSVNGNGILYEGLDFHRNGAMDNSSFGHYETERQASDVEKIIDEHDKSKPMFMYMASQAVHSATHHGDHTVSLQAPQKYLDRVAHIPVAARRLYAAMMIALDDAIGNVTRALHRNKMLKNTIIVFSTDNGGAANGFAYNDGSNYPLRGQKGTLFEGGTRGVGLIWSPLLTKSGYNSHHLMHVTDWLPTLLSAAGFKRKFKAPLDGVDNWEALSLNKPSNRTEVLYNNSPLEDNSGLRVNDYKLVYDRRGFTYRCQNWYAPEPTVVTGRFCNQTIPSYQMERSDVQNGSPAEGGLYDIFKKLGRNKARKIPYVVECGTPPTDVQTNCVPQVAPCLFNVVTDPCEFRNLANVLPDVVAALMARSNQLKAEAMAPIMKPVDPQGFPENHCGVWNWWLPQPSIPTSCMPHYSA